ncbi:double-strand break repair protein AddB [Dinoroseobacter sp. S76]|uniref:double-strand break repair protein AddB n=1 Tax=Dinoroseobacter sp. S76 TaxID=3415124 RepID=UPI003C79DCD0
MTGPSLFPETKEPRVFGVPIGLDFPQASLDGLLARLEGQPPEALARVEIYVNTARMQRRLKDLLSRDGRAGFLPRIRLLTDIGARDLTLPPATPNLQRQLELSALVAELLAAAPDIAPRSALFDLSASLVRLLDECEGEGVSLDRLTSLDVGDLSAHWERALRFISIVAPFLDSSSAPPGPQGRQRQAVLRQIARWETTPPSHPILIIGSTGSRGTTARLMEAVARLPQGALILPGFDFDQPASVWSRMTDALSHEDHPQFRYARLLADLDLRAEDLPHWIERPAPAPARNRLASLALRPAPVTDQWRAEGPGLSEIPEALAGVTLIEASSQREEALSIATALRAAAAGNRHVALITPDRTLTRQVTAALDRWRILPDDSAGKPLILSPPGRLLRHVAALMGTELKAADLLVTLKHPLTHSEHPERGQHLLHTRDLELWFRKTPGRAVTPESLRAWARTPQAKTEAVDPSRAPWVDWVIATLFDLARTPPQSIADLETLHRARTEQLAAGPDRPGSGGLWDMEAGAQALKSLDQLRDAADAGGTITPRDYGALLASILAAGEVRDPIQPDPRITFWGTLEARVQGADLVILAGLNEGIWPGLPDPDPWMNRRMRHEAGLLVPERQVGLSAHDFQQAFGAKEVILTRATRDSEAETVPSRWLNRLTNLLDGIGQTGQTALAEARARGDALIATAGQLDRPGRSAPASPRPSPKVQRSQIRPRISASRVETLIRDPYQIYASDVLKLRPLEPLDPGPTPALRGTVFHAIMEAALKDLPKGAEITEAHLIDTATQVIGEAVPWPETQLQWVARFASFAGPLAAAERARLASAQPLALEVEGQTLLSNGVTLSCNADRIDRTEDGGIVLYDYKTGQLPSPKQIDALVKQLHLEAIIAVAGDFKDLPPLDVTRISYLRLNKGLGDTTRDLAPDEIGKAREAFVDILDGFLAGTRGYTARRMPRDLKHVSEYDHLSRFGEWDQTDLPSPEEMP